MTSDSGEEFSGVGAIIAEGNFNVVVRVRPALGYEKVDGENNANVVTVDGDNKTLTISMSRPSVVDYSSEEVYSENFGNSTHRFTFDHVYAPSASQQDVYTSCAQDAIINVLHGYNATILAYGQTGAGKTYSMEGEKGSEQKRGIIPRAIEDIFRFIENDSTSLSRFLVRASYLQIYNEVISDLLKPQRTNLQIREDKRKGVYVEGLSEWVVRSPAEIHNLLLHGSSQRATGSTKVNEFSSRSHAVCLIIVENAERKPESEDGMLPEAEINRGEGGHSFKVGKLNFVDLAGSERVRITGATGQRLEESKKINQSLAALGNVISALTDARRRAHIPYRDSKLTRLLQDSLGGNCKTTMMAMISPSARSFSESVSTLKFANRAKNIRNEAHINEDLDQKTLLRKYERELLNLRKVLKEKSKSLVDKRRVLELEEQKKQLEEDKMAAIMELERKTQEFLRQKEEKLMLEERIVSMQSKLLIGGQKTAEDGIISDAVRDTFFMEQTKFRDTYENRMAALEKERLAVEEEKAQVERYKLLLLKQRDIMIALTSKLDERDRQILELQEELEAYDTHQRKLEDAHDRKSAELIQLRKAALEYSSCSPDKSQELVNALGAWHPGNLFNPLLTPRKGVHLEDMSKREYHRDDHTSLNESHVDTSNLQSGEVHLRRIVQNRSSKNQSGSKYQAEKLLKERNAIKSILTTKLSVLAERISCAALKMHSVDTGNQNNLLKDAKALVRVLKATISALDDNVPTEIE